MVGSFAREPLSEPDEEPAPVPDQYIRQSSAFDRVPTVPLPCPPAPDPPLYCQDSAGPSVLTPPVEPDVEPPVPGLTRKESHRSPPDVVLPEPLLVTLPFPTPDPPLDEFAPDPVPQKSTGPFGLILLPPLLDEPVPDPEPPRSTGPFGAELLLPLLDEPDPEPVPQKSTGPFVVEPPLPLVDEPDPDPVPQRSPWRYTRYSFPLTRSVYAS